VGAVGVPVSAGLARFALRLFAVVANAVVASCVVLVAAAAVGAAGTPVNVGLAMLALRLLAVVANAVVASCVVFVAAAAVGAAGTPVNVGLAVLALAFNCVWIAEVTLSTKFNSVIVAVKPVRVVAVVAVVAVDALPVRAAVTVPAVKFPLPSRCTMAPAVFALVAEFIKAVTSTTADAAPTPVQAITALRPARTVTLPPEPCVKITLRFVALRMKYVFAAVAGAIVTVAVPPGVPVNVIAAYCPFDRMPSEVVSVRVVPTSAILATPLAARSTISKLSFVVWPHRLVCSPSAISSMPVFGVNVLGIAQVLTLRPGSRCYPGWAQHHSRQI
jgi:hypothetical protein